MPLAVWPDWAKFRQLAKSLAIFDSFFLFGKMLTLLWQIWYIIGLIFIVANGQILKNNLTVWSHWPLARPNNVFGRTAENILERYHAERLNILKSFKTF